MVPHKPVPVLAVVAALLSWACAYPVVRLALPFFAPVPLAAARYMVAACLVVCWLCVKRPTLPRLKDIPRFLACGGIGIALYNILFNTGEQTVSAGAASLLLNTAPFLAAIAAVLFLNERLTVWGWLGSLISFTGVVIIGSGQPGGLGFGSGTTVMLAAALCSATYYLLQRPLVTRYGALVTTAYILLIGAGLLLPWLPSAINTHNGWQAWALVGVLGVFPSILGYGAWAHVVGQVGVARSSGLLYLLSPTTLLLAFVLVREVPNLRTLIGGCIVMAGVGLMQMYGHPRPQLKAEGAA